MVMFQEHLIYCLDCKQCQLEHTNNAFIITCSGNNIRFLNEFKTTGMSKLCSFKEKEKFSKWKIEMKYRDE